MSKNDDYQAVRRYLKSATTEKQLKAADRARVLFGWAWHFNDLNLMRNDSEWNELEEIFIAKKHAMDHAARQESVSVPRKTSAKRMAKLRAKATTRGWKRRDYYATPQEHDELQKRLEELRP